MENTEITDIIFCMFQGHNGSERGDCQGEGKSDQTARNAQVGARIHDQTSLSCYASLV